MNDDKTNALTDMAYYHGARHAMTALSAGMDPKALSDEMEARVAPARKWLAENRRSQEPVQPKTRGRCRHGVHPLNRCDKCD